MVFAGHQYHSRSPDHVDLLESVSPGWAVKNRGARHIVTRTTLRSECMMFMTNHNHTKLGSVS